MRNLRARRILLIVVTLLTVAAACGHAATVSYRGVRLAVPAGWPVIRVGPTTCVRFDRHAVYLGAPGRRQSCPAGAVGQTEAILVEPRGAAVPSFGVAAMTRRAIVIATWNRHRRVVERALGVVRLSRRVAAPVARTATAGLQPTPSIYTGLGFDACSAPSPATMSAWGSSPYRAIGIYIGGANVACSQTNLSANWVTQETAAGWHLIPTYVGLQAPNNSCGCKPIVPKQATAEGTSAADDAVAQLQVLGIGQGNVVYDDMEYYPRSSTNSPAVLAYLKAWTTELHAAGYLAGVYGNANSVFGDLLTKYGTTYPEPDAIWIANWNGVASTSDPGIPSSDWSSHQRIHQYAGGHNETYCGVTINIDQNYVDAPAVSSGSLQAASAVASIPSLKICPHPDATITLYASWAGATNVASWQFLGGLAPTALAPVVTTTSPQLVTHDQFPYFEVQALDASGNVLGASPVITTPSHLVLYGHTAYVPRHGLGSVAAGCFTGAACRIRATLSVGGSVLATTAPERVPAGGGGLVYFKPTPAARAILRRLHGHLPGATVSLSDSSGASATGQLNLVSFGTKGRAPLRALTNAPTLRIAGATEFVGGGGIGAIPAACLAPQACEVTTTLTARGSTIATTGPEFLGANALSNLYFKLTPQGRALLKATKGNMLGARVLLTDGVTSAVASGRVVLVSAR